jgi:tetratricopeptide (TPR) repeat protein
LFDKAVRLEEEGKNEEALAVWQELAKTNPTRNVFLCLASVAKDLGFKDEAERAFKRALEIDERSTHALKGLGILAIDAADYQAAVEYLSRASAIEEDPGGLSLLGVALKNIGEPLEAEVEFRRAIRINPDYEEAYFNLATLFTQDRPSEAHALLRKAIELDPEYAAAHRELGFLLMKRSADGDAERHLRKAVTLDPNDGWASIYLGTYLWLSKNVHAAIEEFQRAKSLEPNWAVPLWSLGNIYDQESIDLEIAQSFFERALAFQPDNWNALKGIARVHNKQGRFALAKEFITRALQQHPKHAQSLELLKQILSREAGDR